MENVMTGLVVMVIGMTVVYAFLAIMIWIMELSAKAIQILNKYFPEPIEETKSSKKKVKTDDTDIAVAIALAFQKEREKC